MTLSERETIMRAIAELERVLGLDHFTRGSGRGHNARIRQRATYQSITTLPELPLFIASKPEM